MTFAFALAMAGIAVVGATSPDTRAPIQFLGRRDQPSDQQVAQAQSNALVDKGAPDATRDRALHGASAQTKDLRYRGFSVAIIGDHAEQTDPALLAVVKEQIDIVCAVGLSRDTMAFLESIPIEVAVHANGRNEEQFGTPGSYSEANRRITLFGNLVGYSHRPVLLHEMMHAYHDQRMPGGIANADIRMFFGRAAILHAYRGQSHMMSDVKEFFACSATTYLYGVTGQEPFRRELLREHQPTYYSWLTKLFGSDAGQFKGSIQ